MSRPSTKARERLLETTRELFRRQGYHATGLNQIVEESHSPKGSLYHYFPGGKEELAVAAVNQAATELRAQVQYAVDQTANTSEALQMMGDYMSEKLKTTSFAAACPISTVALETAHQSSVLQGACSQAFASMLEVIIAGLIDDGYDPAEARSLGTLMLSTYLGGLLLSRTDQSTTALETSVQALRKLVPPGRGPKQRRRPEQPTE